LDSDTAIAIRTTIRTDVTGISWGYGALRNSERPPQGGLSPLRSKIKNRDLAKRHLFLVIVCSA
jgi:hypothetical protein